MTDQLTFDDLHVGQTFRAGPIRMDRDRIVEFGREFDPQPQHLDEAAASSSIFGGLVASGWHTAAATMRLLVESVFGRFADGTAGAGLEQIAWPAPVRPGDELVAESEILAVRPSRSRPDRGLMTLRTITRNQRGETVMTVTANVVVPRRDSSAGEFRPGTA